MPSITLTLSSTNEGVVGTVTNSGNFLLRHEKFGLYQYPNWEVSCESIDWVNAEYNVAAKYNNNTINYRVAGAPFSATIPDGRYTVTALRTAFTTAVIANGHFTLVSGVQVPFWSWNADASTLRFTLEINDPTPGNTLVDFASAIPFYGLVSPPGGFPYTVSVTTTMDSLGDVNNSTTSYYLVIDGLVRNTWIGNSEISFVSHFQPQGDPGSTYRLVRNPRQWFDVNKNGRITEFRVRVLNQDGVQVEMPGGNQNPLTVELRFRPTEVILDKIV